MAEPGGAIPPQAEPEHGPDLSFGFNRHEWGVLIPLAAVGFFLNYDTGLLSIGGPTIADGLGVSASTFGIGVAIIRSAALLNLPVLRAADRVGRRRMLLISVVAFTVTTALTSLAWGLVSFVAFQMVARLFLATEETLAGIVISEELRPDRRGAGLTWLGVLGMSGFGLVSVLILAVPHTPLDWRLLYVAALPPLLLVVWLRRNLRETTAFAVAEEEERVQERFLPHVPPAHRPRLWRITLVLGSHGAVTLAAFFYASDLAQNGYDWEGAFTAVVIGTGPFSLLGFVVGGRLSDRAGRRPVLFWSAVTFAVGVALVFSEQRWLFAPGWFVLAGSDAALTAVRPAYISELFPTELRATLAAFIYGVIIAAGSLGLVAVGVLDGVLTHRTVLAGLTAVMVVGLLALRDLPETVGDDVVAARTDGGK